MAKTTTLSILLILIFGLNESVGQTLYGHVSDSTNNIAGATISVKGTNFKTTTDNSGNYEILLSAGSFEVEASYTGYAAQQQTVSLLEGERVNLNFFLSSKGNLDEVVVTASRKPQKISQIPGTVWVVSGVELQQQTQSGVPLKEALGLLIPGLDIGAQGRTNYGQNQRGRSTLVMIDGISLNSTRGISRQFESIDPFNIDRIEVISGSSSIYGGGATGGIVNIITKRGVGGKVNFETEVSGRSGLRDKDDHDLRVAQSIAGGNDRLNARLGVAYQQNAGAFDSHNRQLSTDITQTDLQYNRSIDIFGSVGLKINEKQQIDLNLQYFNSKFNGDRALYLGPNLSGAFGGNPELLGMRDGFESDVNPRTDRKMASLNYRLMDVLGGQDLYVQAFGRQEKLDFYPFPGTLSGKSSDENTEVPQIPYMSSSKQNTDFYGMKAVLNKDFKKLSINYGLDLDRETFNSSQVIFNPETSYSSGGLINKTLAEVGRYPDFSVFSLAGFAQLSWSPIDNLNLSGGIRQQRLNVDIDDFIATNQQSYMAQSVGKAADAIPGGKSHYDLTLFNGAIVYNLSAGKQQVWGNYAQGFTLADPAKYYGQGSYLYIPQEEYWSLQSSSNVGSSPLTGIKTQQFELGWRLKDEHLQVQAATFYAWSDKSLKTVPITLTVDVIDDNRRNFGFEGQINYQFLSQFSVGSNILLIRSQTKTEGKWGNQNVSEASPSKLTVFAAWNKKKFSLRLQGLQSFKLEDAAENQLQDYTLFDLSGSYRLPFGKLTAAVQNLFNNDYQTIWSQRAQQLYKGLGDPSVFYFPGRGRTFTLTYSISY